MPRLPLHALNWSRDHSLYELYTQGQLEQRLRPADEAVWLARLREVTSFAFHGASGSLNVYKEARPRGGQYWYAYHTTRGRTHKRYLGRTARVSLARLEETAQALSNEHELSSVPPSFLHTSPEAEQRVTLLSTKLSPPRLPISLVERDRLLADLDGALSTPLTLLSASAGWGKTTLLSVWASRHPHQVAWLSLDVLDNDLTRFWGAVIAALRTCLPDIGEVTLALLHSPQPAPLSTWLPTLLNEITDCSREIVLVLDDYHVIEDQAIHDALIFLLDHVPANLHLVLSSRTDPALPLSRLRVRGQMTEIRNSDLRFTKAETTDFLTLVMGLPLVEEDVATLEQRTEGWIAGLHLAALSLRKHKDLSAFVKDYAGSHRHLLDYVQQEILASLTAPMHHFLLQTSILTSMNAALCQAVLAEPGEPASQEMLEVLERANLFVVPLDEQRQWYRFHDLFRQALLARLQATQSELVPHLHQRAAHWYDRQGNVHEAIAHALAAADYDFVAALMKRSAMRLWLNGEARMMHIWVKQLPEAVVRTHARLVLTVTLYFLNQTQFTPEARGKGAEARVQVEQHMAWLEDVLRGPEDAAARPAAEERFLRNRLSLLREWLSSREAYWQGNREQLRLIGSRMQDLAQEEDVVWKILPAFQLVASSELQGEIVSLVPLLLEMKHLAVKAQNRYEALWVMAWLSHAYVVSGQPQKAYQICVEALGLLQQERLGAIAGYLNLNLATLYWMQDQLEEAQARLQTVMHYAQTWQHVGLLTLGYCSAIQVSLAEGKLGEAEQLLGKTERLAQQNGMELDRPRISAARVQIWLAQGNLAAAEDWAAHMGVNPQALAYTHEPEYMALVRVSLALKKYAEALHLLASLLTWAERDQRGGNVVQILALQVVALQASGETLQARRVAVRLLHLTESEAYLRVYLDAGEPMQRVIQSLLTTPDDAVSLAYLSTLLAAFHQEEQKRAHRAGAPPVRLEEVRLSSLPLSRNASPAMKLLESLTQREQEVLRLLSQGASNQQIANQLIISLATARKHVSNILGKLETTNRTQAIVRAREYGLL